MPTPGERKALIFLAGIALLGAGVRVVRAVREDAPPDSAAERGLAAQLGSVDSARSSRKGGKKSERRGRTTAVRTPPPASASSPRHPPSLLDLQHRAPLRDLSTLNARRSGLTIDLDLAPAHDIEQLPFIGPVLAARIVADRDSLGPFGSLEAFQRVRGVGPRLTERLRGSVTFSGSARPNTAMERPRKRALKSVRAPSEARRGR